MGSILIKEIAVKLQWTLNGLITANSLVILVKQETEKA